MTETDTRPDGTVVESFVQLKESGERTERTIVKDGDRELSYLLVTTWPDGGSKVINRYDGPSGEHVEVERTVRADGSFYELSETQHPDGSTTESVHDFTSGSKYQRTVVKTNPEGDEVYRYTVVMDPELGFFEDTITVDGETRIETQTTRKPDGSNRYEYSRFVDGVVVETEERLQGADGKTQHDRKTFDADGKEIASSYTYYVGMPPEEIVLESRTFEVLPDGNSLTVTYERTNPLGLTEEIRLIHDPEGNEVSHSAWTLESVFDPDTELTTDTRREYENHQIVRSYQVTYSTPDFPLETTETLVDREHNLITTTKQDLRSVTVMHAEYSSGRRLDMAQHVTQPDQSVISTVTTYAEDGGKTVRIVTTHPNGQE